LRRIELNVKAQISRTLIAIIERMIALMLEEPENLLDGWRLRWPSFRQ
jgi:hypothetical protein